MSDSARMSVRITDVSVSFPIGRRTSGRSHTALRNISLEIRHGQKLAVVGRNGCGKSTLLRLIAGTISPDTGTIERDHGLCQLLTLGAGFVNNLSGRDNAILAALYQGMKYREIVAKLPAIAEFAEIGDFFDRPLNTYSSGMRARLGFAVALQLEPDLLLLDEVLGVGDADFRRKSKNALRQRLKSDATVVLVSHDENTINTFCDQAIWIEKGVIQGAGDVETILAQYTESRGSGPGTR